MSVLFADLVGFTARAETLDPEDVEAILAPFHDRLRTELEQRGGTVEKFIGDAVMAVFGAPVAHEDDPERAVRAALAIRDWIREEGDLEVRIAVNTGEVLVSLEPSPGAERGLVAGDVVNTASRLQSAAPVNGIIVGATTYNATSRTIDYRDAPPVAAKGKSEPIAVWEVVEARSRFGEDVTRDSGTPLVGRKHEVETLARALARATQERSPQLVTVSGVPGIGKTRIVQELFLRVDSAPELVFWRQGRCLPYGESGFWALGEIVKAHAGILEGEAAEEAAAKLRAVVEEAIPDEDDAVWAGRHLGSLIGFGDAAEAGDPGGDRRTEAFAAWRRFFEGLSDLSPLVLVFEDLHWADEGLLDFIDHLVDWAGDAPILVVVTARPELLTRRATWGGGKPNATAVSLSPLSEEETATLIHGLLERAVLPAETQATLLDRAGGNPLYAQEFARIARDRHGTDGGELPLPESVQGLIAARLDTLTSDEKALLQDAAVIGKVFWRGAVAALGDRDDGEAEALLHALERKQYVRTERRSSVGGDTQHTFVHGLVREVAYGQIPRAQRAEKHRRAAEWIEGLGRPEDHVDLLAHHYVSALDAAQASRQDTEGLADAARFALRDAGDRANALGSFQQAAAWYDRAATLWPDDDLERTRISFDAALARYEHAFANVEELVGVRDALLAAGDLDRAVQAEQRIVNVRWLHGRGDERRHGLERLLQMAAELPLSPTKALAYSYLSSANALADRLEDAQRFGEDALAMAAELGLDFVRGHVLGNLGVRHAAEGDRQGLALLEQSVEILRALNTPYVIRSYNNLRYSLSLLGEVERARAVGDEQLAEALRWGGVEWLRWARGAKAENALYAGQWAEAEEICDSLLAGVPEGESHYLEPTWRLLRSRILLARGDAEAADSEARVALERARSSNESQVLLPALSWRAVQLQARGDSVEALAREVLDIHGSTSRRVVSEWFIDAATVLGALGWLDELDELARDLHPTPWRDSGLALGRGEFAHAVEIFERMSSRYHAALSRLYGARAWSHGESRQGDRVLPRGGRHGLPRRGSVASRLRAAAPEADRARRRLSPSRRCPRAAPAGLDSRCGGEHARGHGRP